MMTKAEAEAIVFHKYLNNQASEQLEKELLDEGDSLLSVEKGVVIKWEDEDWISINWGIY